MTTRTEQLAFDFDDEPDDAEKHAGAKPNGRAVNHRHGDRDRGGEDPRHLENHRLRGSAPRLASLHPCCGGAS